MSQDDIPFDGRLLAQDALAFFGLTADWVELDLRRAYTRLIRRWKPEKFPEEFKAIHTAYERLKKAAPKPAKESPATPDAPPPPVTPPGKNHDAPESDEPNTADESIADDIKPTRIPREPRHLAPPPDDRSASVLLREAGRAATRGILESRKNKSSSDFIALAYLRSDAGQWPPFCLPTVVAALDLDDEYNGSTPASDLLERTIHEALSQEPGFLLERLEPLRERSYSYFSLTEKLWDTFAKNNPAACALRFDRLVRLEATGKSLYCRHFLLRFCITHSMRLPREILREWTDILCRTGKGFEDHLDTLKNPGAAIRSPLRIAGRKIGEELDFLEAILKVRANLESETLSENQSCQAYHALLCAYLDGDAEKFLEKWKWLSARTGERAVPWINNSESAHRVFLRVRDEMDSLVVDPDAPVIYGKARLAKIPVQTDKLLIDSLRLGWKFLTGGFCIAVVIFCLFARDFGPFEVDLHSVLKISGGFIFMLILIGAPWLFAHTDRWWKISDQWNELICTPIGTAVERGYADRSEIRTYLWMDGCDFGKNLLAQFDKYQAARDFRTRLFAGTRR